MAASARDDLIVALDVGTTSVRALLYDTGGRPLGPRTSRPTPLNITADGGAEVDASQLIEAVEACLEELGPAARGCRVVAVATCTFWHSLLGLDDTGRPLTPVYTWADTRSERDAHALRRRLDEAAVHARTGCHFHSSYWPAKLAWLRRTQPRLFGQVRRWVSPAEYLSLSLCGDACCSLSMASGTGLLNHGHADWDDELLQALGLDRSQVSKVVEQDTAHARLLASRRRRLAWLAGAPWLPALGDGACNNVGSGCIGRERLALMIGTSGALRLFLPDEEAVAPWGLWCYRVDRRRFLVGGAISNGGNLYAWLRQTLQLPPGPDVEQQLAALPPDGHGLTVLPFLAGERNPGYATSATATISGLRWHTQPLQILQACLEAAGYRLALIYECLAHLAAPEAVLVASGAGLLQSPAWMQMLANILGRRIVTGGEAEASSRGAALLAAEAMGYGDIAAGAMPPAGRSYEPDPERYERYRKGLERHRRLYRRLLGSASLPRPGREADTGAQ
ncbi:MAG: gluconokinase [Anaerolineae bacterium]